MGAASARQGRTDWLLIWMIGSTALDRLRNESTQVNNSFAKNNLQKQRLARSMIDGGGADNDGDGDDDRICTGFF